MVANGHARIQEMILTGAERGFWKVADIPATAKMIQIQITGALVSSTTESGFLNDEKAVELTLRSVRYFLEQS